MKNNKIAGYIEIIGLTIVVVASALWIFRMEWVSALYACGTVVFAIGRLMIQRTIKADNITAKRLLRQRTFAVFVLLFSSILMFMQPGWYFGYNFYLTKSAWLVPFVVFVIIEVYTAFRLPVVLKKC